MNDDIEFMLKRERLEADAAGTSPYLCRLDLTEGEVGVLLRLLNTLEGGAPQVAPQATYLIDLLKAQMENQWNGGATPG